MRTQQNLFFYIGSVGMFEWSYLLFNVKLILLCCKCFCPKKDIMPSHLPRLPPPSCFHLSFYFALFSRSWQVSFNSMVSFNWSKLVFYGTQVFHSHFCIPRSMDKVVASTKLKICCLSICSGFRFLQFTSLLSTPVSTQVTYLSGHNYHQFTCTVFSLPTIKLFIRLLFFECCLMDGSPLAFR